LRVQQIVAHSKVWTVVSQMSSPNFKKECTIIAIDITKFPDKRTPRPKTRSTIAQVRIEPVSSNSKPVNPGFQLDWLSKTL
jgi:hypothetical protein